MDIGYRRIKTNSLSKYFGVTHDARNNKSPWLVYIDYKKQRKYYGSFESAIDAAIFRNNKIKELNLPDNMLNKIEETTTSETYIPLRL